MVDIADAAQKTGNTPPSVPSNSDSPPADNPLEGLLNNVSPVKNMPQEQDPAAIMDSVLNAKISDQAPPPENELPQQPIKPSGKKKLGPIVAVLVLLLLTIPLTVFYIRQRQELRKEADVSVPSSCANGGFMTASGKRYCFIVNGDIQNKGQAQLACQQYGTFASFLDGDNKQDVLDVISQFNADKSTYYQNISGGDPDDGAYFADSCNEFKQQFGQEDTALYWGDPEGSGRLDCSEQPMSFGRSSDVQGRINDTRDGNGRGAVCELPPATITPTPGRPDLCQSLTVSKTTLAPGESVTISSTSKSNANNFSYAFYNMDNLYGVDNPKPICVTQGGDNSGTTPEYCPAGTIHLGFRDQNTGSRSTGSRTITYEDIFLPDQNNSGAITSRVQINGYFRETDGLVSQPNPTCVGWINASVGVSPTLSPTATLTPTLTPTSIPTGSPTNIPESSPTPTSPSVGGPIDTPPPTNQPLAQVTPTSLPVPTVPVSGIGPGIFGISIVSIGSLLVLLGLVL